MAIRAAITASASQIAGTTTNDNAGPGILGEFVQSIVTNAAPVNIVTTNVSQNLTSISLTAGDWDVSGLLSVNPSVGTTGQQAGVGTVTNTLPAVELQTQANIASSGRYSMPIPRQRVSINVTTTIFLVGTVQFASGTCTMYGFLNARRAR